MSANAFVTSTFASARWHLKAARKAQCNAYACLVNIYDAGERGARARKQWVAFDGRRTAHLALALEARANAKALRRKITEAA